MKKSDIDREAAKNQHCHEAKLINVNISQMKKYCPLIKAK